MFSSLSCVADRCSAAFDRASTGLLAAVIAAAVCATGASPAVAADQTVRVADSNYTAPGVAVMPGDSVTWSFPSGADHHNVHFEDEQYTAPPMPAFAPWM